MPGRIGALVFLSRRQVGGGLAYGGDQEGGGWADGWGRRGRGRGREREGGASVSLARCVSSFLMYG